MTPIIDHPLLQWPEGKRLAGRVMAIGIHPFVLQTGTFLSTVRRKGTYSCNWLRGTKMSV